MKKKHKEEKKEDKKQKKRDQGQEDSFEQTLVVSLSSDFEMAGTRTADAHHYEAEVDQEEILPTPLEGNQTGGTVRPKGISSPIFTSDVSCSVVDPEDVYASHFPGDSHGGQSAEAPSISKSQELTQLVLVLQQLKQQTFRDC